MTLTGETDGSAASPPGLPDMIRLAAVWVLASLVSYLSLQPTMGLALHWDEVHYVLAAQMGIMANATDATAFSPGDLIEFLLAKSQGRTPRVSPEYDETRDLFVVRHSHPPLQQYALALLGPERLRPRHEVEQRLVQFAGGALLIGTMLWGYAVMASRRTLPGMILVAISGVLCAFYLSRDLNSHLWIAVSMVPVCIAVGRLMGQPSPRTALITGGILAIAFLGLETGLFVAFWAVVALGISIFFQGAGREEAIAGNRRFKLRLWLKYTAWMIAGFFAVVLVTYPGAIFRVSLFRLFAIYAYRTLNGDDFGGVNVWPALLEILPQVLPLVVLGLIGTAGIALRSDPRGRALLIATAIIGFGYGLVMTKFALHVTYVTPAMAPLSVLGAVAISSSRSKLVPWLATGVMAALAAWIIFTMPVTIIGTNQSRPTVAQVEGLGDLMGSRRAWIDGAHVVQYYRPDLADRIGSITVADKGAVLTTRDHKSMRYEPITDELTAGSVVMLCVINGRSTYAWENRLPEGTRKLDSSTGLGRVYVFPDKIPPRADSPVPAADPGQKDDPARKNSP